MFKKSMYVLMVVIAAMSMMAFASPVSAAATRLAKGTVIAIDMKTRTLTVLPLKGASIKIKVGLNTTLLRKGKAVTFNKLRVGDKTSLSYNSTTKLADHVEDTPGLYEIHGTIEAVDVPASTLTVASEEGGNSVTLKVNAATVILSNKTAASLSDLLVGEKVEAKYDSNTMLASSIKSEIEDGELHGVISAVDLTGKSVSITPDLGGADIVLHISESTVIKRDDMLVALSALHIGDKAEAAYDSASLIASLVDAESH